MPDRDRDDDPVGRLGGLIAQAIQEIAVLRVRLRGLVDFLAERGVATRAEINQYLSDHFDRNIEEERQATIRAYFGDRASDEPDAPPPA